MVIRDWASVAGLVPTVELRGLRPINRAPTENPDENGVGPSGPEVKKIDEITGLDNHEFTTPLKSCEQI
jgi:hypothetical protein